MKQEQKEPSGYKDVGRLSTGHMERSRLASEGSVSKSYDGEDESNSSQLDGSGKRDGGAANFVGGPANWYCV